MARTQEDQLASDIAAWMAENHHLFIDRSTEELNLTEMVEAWDRECCTGEATLDPDHIAWEVAVGCTPG